MFYERLEELCRKNNTTPTAICKLITKSPGNLATWKNGNARNDHLIALAKHFNVSVDYLLGRSDKPTPEKPTLNPRPDLVIPDILQQVGIGFHEGAENLTQEDIDDMAFALELRRKRK